MVENGLGTRRVSSKILPPFVKEQRKKKKKCGANTSEGDQEKES